MRCCSRFTGAIIGVLLAVGAAARGAELEQLTRDGRLKFTPVFHDGGNELVFVELVNPTLYQIRRWCWPPALMSRCMPMHDVGV